LRGPRSRRAKCQAGIQILLSLPTSEILRSASLSAAATGGTPSSPAIEKILRVVSKIFSARSMRYRFVT
jgi:hypothetical protein